MGPYARYRQHPAVVTAPFIAPGRFIGESCVAAADFGTVRRNILHVFDKGASPDMSQLAAQVSGAVVGISGVPSAPELALPSYGVPIGVPVAAGSSASSVAAVGAGGSPDGAALGAGLGAGGLGAGGLGAAPDAAAAGASGSSGRK